MTDENAEKVAALIHEREGYVRSGNTKRVAEVDRELSRLGQKGRTPAKRAEKRSA